MQIFHIFSKIKKKIYVYLAFQIEYPIGILNLFSAMMHKLQSMFLHIVLNYYQLIIMLTRPMNQWLYTFPKLKNKVFKVDVIR